MPQLIAVAGKLCGSDVYSYKAFESDTGDKVPGGTVRYVTLCSGLDSTPDRVKVDEAQFLQLMQAGFLADVVLACEAFSKNNRVEWRCSEVVETPSHAPVK